MILLHHDRLTSPWLLTLLASGLIAAAALFLLRPWPVAAVETRYDLGERIPSQTIWHGGSAEFLVAWTGHLAASFSFATSPAPSGIVTLEPQAAPDWRFRFAPDPDDRLPFSVRITAHDGAETIAQTFDVVPMAMLRPEQRVFGADEDYILPQPTIAFAGDSARGFKVTEAPCTGTYCSTQPINHGSSTPRFVRIVGESVELAAGTEPYDSYDQVASGTSDIARMEIIAERVTIRDPLRLPQTAVSIHARELIFVGEPGPVGTTAAVITTPLSHPLRATPNATPQTRDADGKRSGGVAGANGRAGLAAGPIDLYVQSLASVDIFDNDVVTPRLVLQGGRGQNPGLGVDGAPAGYSVDSRSCVTRRYDPLCGSSNDWCAGDHGYSGYRIIWARDTSFWGTDVFLHSLSETDMPIEGLDGQPAGAPGKGGDGGTLISNVAPGGLAFHAYGPAGTRGRTYTGGSGSNPAKALRVQHDTNIIIQCRWFVVEERATTPSSGAVSPAAPAHGTGDSPGGVVLADNPHAWLHPLLVGWALNSIKDDYLSNRVAQAEERLQRYVQAIEDYIDDPSDVWNSVSEDDQFALVQMYDDMQVLLSQIESNLDYFGNAAGWVPMLSFETYLTAFDNEIDRSIRMLYLSYWIKTKAANDNQTVAALAAARDELRGQLEDAKADFAAREAEIEDLTIRANNLQAQTLQKRLEMQDLEDQLREQAEEGLREPLWALFTRSALKGAATAFSIFPVWQPELGTIGDGIRTISNVDVEKPWELIFEEADVANQFLTSAYDSAARQVNTEVTKVKAPDVETKKREYLRNLKEASGGLSESLKDMREFLSSIEAPKEEVDAEVERLKGQSPEFEQLSEEVHTLIDKSANTTWDIINTMQEVNSLTNLITANIIEIAALNRSVSAGEAVVNQDAVLYLENMERRTYDRLLKYHYYLAKSYEYRLLAPYPEQLDLSALLERFQQVAAANVGNPGEEHLLSGDQFVFFKAAYENILANVAETILSGYSTYQTNVEKQTDFFFNLTPDELDTLNSGGSIRINPVREGWFPADRENIRIFDLGVHTIETVPVGGGYEPLATMQLHIEHPGISLYQANGDVYQFRHLGRSPSSSANPDSRGQAAPIFWETDYQPSVDIFTNTKVSPFTTSLLTTVLGNVPNDIELFSRPSAWADLELTRTVTNNGPGDIHLTGNTFFKLTYDYQNKAPGSLVKAFNVLVFEGEVDSGSPGVVVNRSADFRPYFVVSRADRNGRRDARGRFLRLYTEAFDPGERVSITAQERFGVWRFRQWTDQDGAELPGGPFDDPTIDLQPDADRTVAAQYALPRVFFDADADGDLDGFDVVALSSQITDDLADSAAVRDFAADFGYRAGPAPAVATLAAGQRGFAAPARPFMRRQVMEAPAR